MRISKKRGFVYGSLLFLSFTLSACTSNEESASAEPYQPDDTEEVSKKDDEPTQEEINAKLKEEATQASFVELNSDSAELDKKIFIDGEVAVVLKEGTLGSFTVNTEEKEGSGIYTVNDYSMMDQVTAGDKVKVYGTYSGKAEDGSPLINATIVER
ncbi:hypothetical protein ABES25_10035 [Bacillus gobiensis]|uniref:hypothetical protein n=1 Tax=Bacillus gobiensis TaxID=1441095 RepID=UPI003D197702